ncbi:uncharacterized protein LOC127137432 [Lathyrus oleraceus]|uniref:uncharacterized protein LOC127137432 n=1 Tax=Pisum sativum TaxID=3888 RepID=UPI0021D08476|nr:uncharacterized protein LOC127137432 [Pisum sativum]
MGPQQQSVYNYSQQMEAMKQTPIFSQQKTATTSVVSTPIYKEPHILDREPHIHLATPFDKLEVLCESVVDFDNMKRNRIDLIEELRIKSLPPPSRSVNLKKIASSFPQITLIYTQSETPPSTTKPSDTPTSNPQSPPFQKFNLSTITLPVSIVEMLNNPISPISSTPSSPPFHVVSSYSEPSDPQSPTLAQLQAHALASQPQPDPETNTPPSEQPQTPPSEQQKNPPPEQPTPPPSNTPTIPPSEDIIFPTPKNPTNTTQTPPSSSSPNSEPEHTFPTLEEAITLFVESSVEKIKSLSVNSSISDDPSKASLNKSNDFVRDAGARLHARLVSEDEEKARREAKEKAFLEEEQQVREAEDKGATEVVAAAEAEAKAKAEAEEAAHIAAEEDAKASADALTQGEKSNSRRTAEGATDCASKIGSTGLRQQQHSEPADSIAPKDASSSKPLGT